MTATLAPPVEPSIDEVTELDQHLERMRTDPAYASAVRTYAQILKRYSDPWNYDHYLKENDPRRRR